MSGSLAHSSYIVGSFFMVPAPGVPASISRCPPWLMLVPALDEKRRFGRQGHTRDEPGPSALQPPQRLAPPNQASMRSVSGLPVEAIAAAARNGGTDVLGALPSLAAEPWNGALWPTRLTA
jgi:hypothetical protein